MFNNPIKLKFPRMGRFSQDCAKDNRANIGEIKKSSVICEEKYLRSKNLSIMTDKLFESDVVDNVCLQQQYVGATTLNSSSTTLNRSTSSENMYNREYVIIACEEMPVVLEDTNWKYVNYHDITETIRNNSIVKKYCSPKCSSAWFLKIRREILKNWSNKINPAPTNG